MKQLMLAIGALAALLAGAETRTWLANVDGNWNTPGMWSGGVVPGSGDTADFSNLTGEKTLTLPAAVTVDQIVYAPAVGSATNKVTLAGSTLSVNTSITVGERALLETSCDVRITYIHGYLYTYGLGEWRIAKTLMSDNGSGRKLYQREGRITLASGASMGYGVNLHPGTIDAALSPAEFVVEEDATVNFDKVNDFEFAQAANSRFVFTMNSGTLLPRNAINGGCFLNGLETGSYSVMNINGGTVDGTGKTFYPGFRGTGVVNQTSGKMIWASMVGVANASGHATYNLMGGEIHLAGNFTRNGQYTTFLNVGDAKIVKTGTGSLDVTSPLTITDRFEIDVANAADTCSISCIMEGAGGFVKTGPGTLNWYSAEKRFTGPLVVSNGTVLADVNMPGGNAVTVAGGTLRLYRNRPYTFSSLTICGTGTLQTTNTATVNLPATANVITVKDNGVLALDAGTSCFPGTPSLVIEGDGQVRIPAGATQWFPSVKVGADDLPDGVYTSATADLVDGDGTLVVGNHVWTGAAGDGLWTTAGNWQGGASPFALSGGVDLSAAEGTLTLDAAVTNTALVYAPSGGGVLTNSSAAVLSLAAGSVITVGAGSTLVLDGDVCLLGGSVYKRGGGTLVFAKRMTAGTVGTYPTVYLRVQEGRCVFEGAVKDVSLYSGLWSGSVLTEIPEIVFGPESSLSGVTYLAGVTSDASVDPAPGNGLITQLGGTVSPASGWSTAASMAQGRAGQVAATGTYHLVSGNFVIPSGKTMALAEFNSYGIFTQDGGESSIATIEYNDGTRHGEVNLNGGRMTVGAIGRNNQIRFNFAGGTFAPAGGTLAIPNPWALIGNATFDTPEGATLTFTQVPSGSGGLSKAGAGTLNLSGGVTQSNDVTVAEGALSVGAGSMFGTLALAADATVSLVGVSTATNFTLGGVAQPVDGAVYSKGNCPFITGDGVLLVGGVPGKWNGGADDGKWSSAGNWSGNIIPNGATMDVDLSAAAGTLSFDAGAVTVGSLSYATPGGAGTLTNAAPAGSTDNVLNIAANGVITVGEGETLVLDHPLCMLGQDVYKRGKGTLVLRQGMCSPANRATLDNYFSIEEGVVINEGCVTNVIPVPGAIDRSDPTNVPQFINRAGASLVGTTFIDAMHARDNPPNPGNGLFTQEGGLVEPNIANWVTRGIVGYAPAGASAGGTGTYHLVSGTLRIPAGKVFHMASNNGHGVFVQDGGLFENNGTFGMGNRCSVTLNGGTMRLTTVENQKPIIFSGGVFRPLPAAFTFGSSFEMTGDGAFEVDAGKTMTLNAANPLRGNAPLNKAGEGVLAITGTGAGMTGPVNVDAGTLRLAGAMPNATNFNVAAGATLEVATGTASFNAQTVLRVAKDGKLNLTGTGSVSVDALWLEERPQYGFGRRYGSSSHAGEVDIVDDKHFVGTGVLVVVGKSLGAGTTIILR